MGEARRELGEEGKRRILQGRRRNKEGKEGRGGEMERGEGSILLFLEARGGNRMQCVHGVQKLTAHCLTHCVHV